MARFPNLKGESSGVCDDEQLVREHSQPGTRVAADPDRSLRAALAHPDVCDLHPDRHRRRGGFRQQDGRHRRLSKRGGEPGVVLDIILWAVPLGIIGARVYHVITHPADYFFAGADLWKTLYIWEGGNAIFGALVVLFFLGTLQRQLINLKLNAEQKELVTREASKLGDAKVPAGISTGEKEAVKNAYHESFISAYQKSENRRNN